MLRAMLRIVRATGVGRQGSFIVNAPSQMCVRSVRVAGRLRLLPPAGEGWEGGDSRRR